MALPRWEGLPAAPQNSAHVELEKDLHRELHGLSASPLHQEVWEGPCLSFLSGINQSPQLPPHGAVENSVAEPLQGLGPVTSPRDLRHTRKLAMLTPP